MKKIMGFLVQVLFLLIPIAFGIWLITLGYPWWLCLLAAAGVFVLLALVMCLITAVRANFKAAWAEAKKNKENSD